MNHNYYIADTHFGHANVIRFDRRPFYDVEEMENVLVHNWNAAVWPGDTVYILGDMVWGKTDEWLRIVKRLKGNKVLIQGNHDLKQYPPELRQHFADIKDYKEVEDKNRRVILSHYPIFFYKHANRESHFMLCGHVHNTPENDFLEKWTKEIKDKAAADGPDHVANLGQIYNVGCMMPWMAYAPRTLDEIIRNHAAYHKSHENY